MKLTYKHTKFACYMGYITGAIINNFMPLLFIIFQKDYGIGLSQLSKLIMANFGIQLVVDFLGAKYVEKIGYRRTLMLAAVMSVAGLVSLGILPVFITPYAGLVISVVLCAVGSGLLEVMVSPTVEALPSDAKASDMSILHSFYCWGTMLVVLVSTAYFHFIGVERWRYLCFLWAMIPAVTTILFAKVPIIPFGKDVENVSFKKIFSSGLFRIFLVIMLCAGASEIAMSQWASLFAETGLGVSKTVGDLLGPCLFAFAMGIARALFGKYGEKLNLFYSLAVSAAICVSGYLITVFSQNPVISLVGCSICGFGSAIMWPGTLSLAAKYCAFGGTAIFGLLAMAGDVGCTAGPMLVAEAAERIEIFASPLKAGILCAAIFPVLMIVFVLMLKKLVKNQ